MPITRQHHLRYMTKLSPILLALYLGQIMLYKHFAPAHMTNDIGLILGLGLAFLILCYYFYDQHHKIICHRNYVEVRFDLLRVQEEFLYRDIVKVEVKQKNQHFGNLILHHRDGGIYRFYHVDNPKKIQAFIQSKS